MRPKPAEYIRRTRESYEKLGFEPYRWFQAESEPAFAVPAKPLAESRLGMISTAGTYVQGQVAYYYKDDTGVRAIPNDTPVDKIRFSHIMENYLVEARQDPATVFPSRVLAKLRSDGAIGELADNYHSCMGGIYSQKRVRAELIPKLTAAIDEQRLDLLFLVPL
ncbi:MAG: hypothetical protein OXG44_20825 [Gammaproteobacteria bacterium]|nr:hypothetical protein [Gammaproteobacteria bacterium]MDE0191709.1 hypothetical protein [Gammaproteobacteria bacterium]